MIPLRRGRGVTFVLRDPAGFSDPVALNEDDAVLTTLMDGRRTLAEIRAEFKAQAEGQVATGELEQLVRELDQSYLLQGDRFENRRRRIVRRFLAQPVRPAAHAGGAYPRQPGRLRKFLGSYFTDPKGPGVPSPETSSRGSLRGIVSPHIDPARGGPAYAWAYRRLVEQSDADLLVILGTAHAPMENFIALSRKDFDTPLGVVRTDTAFVDRMTEHLASSVAGRRIDPLADEPAHRAEHSIEFQAVMLQYMLGGHRDFRIVPILVGSFQRCIEDGSEPDTLPELQALVAAVRAAAAGHAGSVGYISSADLAHIGMRFGDDWLLDDRRLAEQAADDRRLLRKLCRADTAAFYRHVARQKDRRRVCGLSPTWLFLEVAQPAAGELLAYDRAVEPDGTACVTFASVAFA